MPPWRAKIPAWPLRSARITSKPLIVAYAVFSVLNLAHGPDQQLELAVVGLYDVVDVLHLPVPRLCRTFSLSLQLRDGSGIGRRLISVEHLGLLSLL